MERREPSLSEQRIKGSGASLIQRGGSALTTAQDTSGRRTTAIRLLGESIRPHSMRVFPFSPPDTFCRDQLGVPSADVKLGFRCFLRLSVYYFFHPFSPPVALFYSSLAPAPGQEEINVRAPTLPFFPPLFEVKGKAMLQIFASRLRRIVTFGLVTAPQTFPSEEWLEKAAVVLYFPSLDEG